MNRAPYLRCTLALLAILVFGSCTQEDPVDLSGTWQPTEDSVSNFDMPGRPQITLNSDRSFTASGIQKELLYNPEPLSGRGTWKRIGNELFLAFSRINGEDESFEVRLLITDQPKPKLSFYRGDRRSGYRFFFEKN
jgi:hypothetical protein